MPKIYDQQTTMQGGVSALQPLSMPNYDAGIEAAGTEKLGRSLSNVAGTLGDVHVNALQKQKQLDDATGALWATKAVSQARLDWTQKFNQMQSQTNGDGSGFSQQVIGDFNKYQSDLLDKARATNNPAAVKYTQEHMLALGNQLGVQAIETQEKQRISYNVGQLKDTMNTGATTIGIDPNQMPMVYGNTTNAINNSQLPFEQKQALLETWRTDAVNAAASNQIMNNPSGFKNAMAPGVGKLPEGTVQSKIAQAATSSGNNPMVSLAIAQIESGMNPNAESAAAGSTAKGLYQINDKTWLANGGTTANRNDPDAQIQVAQTLQQNNANYLRAHLGYEPTPSQEYMAHFLGAGGAVAAIKADKNMSMAELVRQYDPKNAEATIKGNHLEGKTVGQVLKSYDNKMQAAMNKFAGSEASTPKPLYVNMMTQKERQHYYQLADQVEQQQAATLKVNLNQQIQDHEAQAMNGIMPQQPLTQAQFNQMYPKDPNAASVAYQKYTHTLDFGAKISQLADMTPEQEQGILRSLAPTPNSPGYADDAKLQSEYQRAIAAKHELINKDAVSYVAQNSLVVKKYAAQLQQSNTPENRKMYMDSVIAQQQKLGVMYPKLLDKTQEDSYIQQITHNQGLQRVKYLSSLREQYGDRWGMVANQLKENQAKPEGLTAILSAHNERYAEQAALVSGQTEDALAKQLTTAKSDVDKAVNDAVRPYLESVGTGQQTSPETLDLVSNIRKQVYAKVAMGANEKTAAEDVVAGFTGNLKYNYIDQDADSGGNKTFRVPVKYNQDIVKDNANAVVKQLSIKDIDLANTEPLKNPYDLSYNVDGLLNRIKDNAVWQTDKTDSNATLMFIGNDNYLHAVIGTDGRPVTRALSDLNSNSASAVPKVKTLGKLPAEQTNNIGDYNLIKSMF